MVRVKAVDAAAEAAAAAIAVNALTASALRTRSTESPVQRPRVVNVALNGQRVRTRKRRRDRHGRVGEKAGDLRSSHRR